MTEADVDVVDVVDGGAVVPLLEEDLEVDKVVKVVLAGIHWA